jgi:hypothetical protein
MAIACVVVGGAVALWYKIYKADFAPAESKLDFLVLSLIAAISNC